MAKYRAIEFERSQGEYEAFAEAIIEHPKHGHLYLCEGFGGMDDLCGGAYRWRYGFAAKVDDSTTLEGLTERALKTGSPWSNHRTSMMLERSLPWSGETVEALAKGAGLA